MDSLTVVSRSDVDHDPRVCQSISVSVLQAGIDRISYVRLSCEISSSVNKNLDTASTVVSSSLLGDA